MCDRWKRNDRTFCLVDYKNLPQPLQRDLYKRLGHGYREAVIAALAYHEVDDVALPEAGHV